MAAATILGLALTACGSSKSPSATSSSSTSPTTNGAAGPTTPATAPPTSATAPSSTSATTTPATASGNFDSCSVVTQAEAASALGQAVSAGILGNATVEGGLACVFYGPGAPANRTPNVAQTDTVRVVVVEGSDALEWYNDYKGKVSAQAVSGYGDQAYWDGYASLSVLKGSDYLRIAVAPAGAAPSLSAEKQLASAILPSL